MDNVDTHGLSIIGLHEACADIEAWSQFGPVEINYNMETGIVWATAKPYGPAVVKVGEASAPLTMQEIADRITEAIERR